MKKVWFALMMVFIFSGFSLAHATDNLRIACVDIQKAMENSEIGKKLKNEIQQEYDKAKQKLSERDQELKKLGDLLDKQKLAMNEDVKQEKLKEYQTKTRELERLAKDSEDDLRQKFSDKQQKLLQDFVDIIVQYGKEKGYSMILVKGLPTVLYSVDSLDITDEVIKVFDEKFSPKGPEKQQPKEKQPSKEKQQSK